MSIHQFRLSITVALTLASILVIASPAIAQPSEIALPSDRAYPKALPPRRTVPCTWAAQPSAAYGALNLSRPL